MMCFVCVLFVERVMVCVGVGCSQCFNDVEIICVILFKIDSNSYQNTLIEV